MSIHAGDHYDVALWSDGEEVFEAVLRAEVVDVIITHRQGLAQNRQAHRVRIAADTAESDRMFVANHLKRKSW